MSAILWDIQSDIWCWDFSGPWKLIEAGEGWWWEQPALRQNGGATFWGSSSGSAWNHRLQAHTHLGTSERSLPLL